MTSTKNFANYIVLNWPCQHPKLTRNYKIWISNFKNLKHIFGLQTTLKKTSQLQSYGSHWEQQLLFWPCQHIWVHLKFSKF